MAPERTVGVVLYPDFEVLDVYGPVEAFGSLPGLFRVLMVAEQPGPVASNQGPQSLADHGFAACPPLDVIASCAALFAAAAFGTSRSTPLHGAGYAGTPWQETAVEIGLSAGAVALLAGCALVLWGLSRRRTPPGKSPG